MIHELKVEFPTRKDYEAHDPLVLVRNAKLQTDQVYVSCANRDQYGFFEGSRDFAKLAKQNGVRVQWDPKEGGHCVVDTEFLAHFFSP